MRRILVVVSVLTLQLNGSAQVIYSTAETNKILTNYSGGFSNDSIFVFCGPASLSADGNGGTAPYSFTWYEYQTNIHQFSATPYATQSSVSSSTISSLPSGGYKVIVRDANSTVVGCDIAWVWNIGLTPSAGSTITGCSPFSLNGSVASNGSNTFSYYNPPPDQLIISPSTTITVCFSGTHTWVSDLGFYLVGPSSCGSPNILLSPNPGSNGQGSVCNSGDNFNSLCFTTSPASNLNVCTATTPLTGVYSSYGATPTNINWAPLYGCDASGGGWIVQVYDCIASDVGMLTNATITFSGAGSCGNQTITYNSGSINSAINDNACSASTAASYTVPLSADTTAKTITNALAYNWTSNPSTTITNANSLNPTVNPNPSVDTWFYLNVAGTYGCNKIDSVFFDYTAPATPTITAVLPLCSNASAITLTATPGGGTWSGTGITNTVTGTFDPAVAGAGTFTINYNGTGCTGSTATTITVTQAASLSTMPNIAVCDGAVQGSITFTANPAGASINWTNSQPAIGLASSGSGSVPSFTATNGTQSPVTGVITASATNSGCSEPPISFSVTVNPLPLPNAGQDTGTCLGSSVGLSGSGGGSYSWIPATNLSNSTIANPLASPPSTTVYTLTVTNSFGCQASDMVTVTIHPLPNVSGGSNKIICLGNSVQLNGSGASIYSWAPSTGLNNPAISNPIASPTVTTQFTVTGTDGFGCSMSAVVTVVVNNTPGVTAGADQVICKGNAIVLSGSGSASSYTWSPSAGLSSVNTPTTNASPTVTTSYILSATGSNGCISKDTVQVVVNPLPVANAGNDVAVCIGSSTQLNASGGISYSWSPATGLSSTSVSNPIASPTLQTQYVVTVTDNNGCSKKDSLVIAIHALPNVDAGATRNICPGGITQLGASGASQYTWTPSGSLNSSTASNPMASPATTTNYTVTGRDLNGCENFDTVSVLVGTPLAVSAGGNQTICFGEAVTLTATSSATNYTWQPSASLSNPASATTVAHPTVMTIYTVTASSPGVCPGSATVSVNVNPLPTITAPTVTNVCIGSSIVLNAGGAATYTWAPAGALSNTNTASPVFSGTTNATYTVTGTNVNNCVNFAVVNVVVNALPVIDSIISSPTDCGSTTGQLQITASGVSPFTYSITGHPNQTSSQFTGLAAATYSAQITDVNGCLAGQSIVVGSVNNVHAAFTASPSSGSYPLNVAFTNNSTGANHYNWNFGNATTATAQNASTIYNTVGTYTVALIVYNNIPSCSDTAYQTIEVLDQPKVVIPNIITPNGDGINEEFELIGYGVKSYQAAFFDRWGKKVAEVSGDAGTKWNPANLHDGTYYYVITVTTIDGKTREYHDFLTIIR